MGVEAVVWQQEFLPLSIIEASICESISDIRRFSCDRVIGRLRYANSPQPSTDRDAKDDEGFLRMIEKRSITILPKPDQSLPVQRVGQS